MSILSANLLFHVCVDWDPNPFVRDVHLHAVVSFMKNQIKWDRAYSIWEFEEYNEILWVRGSPQPTKLIFEKGGNF